MERKWWITILVGIAAGVVGFVIGRYLIASDQKPVEVGPTGFFTTFDPKLSVEQLSKDKINWKLLSDEPVNGELYGNPPHARSFSRRMTRLATTVTPNQWESLKGDGLSKILTDFVSLIKNLGSDAVGGQFTLWPVNLDKPADNTTTLYGQGHLTYGGKGGVSSHHGLITFNVIKAGDRVEILFFIQESWPQIGKQ